MVGILPLMLASSNTLEGKEIAQFQQHSQQYDQWQMY
jgi:hypothetical protein